jgi:hypothetical protein
VSWSVSGIAFLLPRKVTRALTGQHIYSHCTRQLENYQQLLPVRSIIREPASSILVRTSSLPQLAQIVVHCSSLPAEFIGNLGLAQAKPVPP